MKKIGFICLALVFALGALGVGFATWSQTLTITEEVNTGEFCVGILDVGTDDPPPALSDDDGVLYPATAAEGTRDPGYTKNVASALSENIDFKCEHEGTDYYHEVKETITNGYPSYTCTITLEFANCGTVPAKGFTVTKVVPAGGDPDGLADYVEITGWVMRNDAGDEVDSGETVAELETALQAYQLDPCDKMQLDITKHIIQWFDINEDGVEDADEICPQNATVTFVEEITWVQWNES